MYENAINFKLYISVFSTDRGLSIKLSSEAHNNSFYFPEIDKHTIIFEDGVFQITGEGIVQLITLLAKSDVSFPMKIDSSTGYKVNFPNENPDNKSVPLNIKNKSQLNKYKYSPAELLRPFFLKEPDNLALLKLYQKEGINWLLKRPKAILADDMGLGKTVQAIRALSELLSNHEITNAIVLCPSSLISNWLAEFQKWAPSICVLSIPNFGRNKSSYWSRLYGSFHVAVANYDQFRSPPKICQEERFDLLIADEAHRLRKPESQIHKSIRGMPTKRFWALTGTPVERDAVDLAAMLSLLEPKKFSPRLAGKSNIALKSQARQYVKRRLKKDVIAELPEVFEKVELLEMTADQRKAYDLLRMKSSSRKLGDVFVTFNTLRALCDLTPEKKTGVKIDRCLDILEEIKLVRQKCIIFSFSLDPLYALKRRVIRDFGRGSCRLLEGEMSIEDRDKALEDFKKNPDCLVLLCSAKVGGEGLTITEANHVIFFNEWWNPSTNWQARDRVVRLGQEREVLVYRLRCKDTIEECLDQILTKKGDLMDTLVNVLATEGSA